MPQYTEYSRQEPFPRRGWLWGSAAMATGGLPLLPPGEEIYDLRGPLSVPFPWFATMAWWTGALLAAWLGWKLLNRMLEPAKPLPAPPPPPPDPLKEALAALERLRHSPIWSENRVKDICETLPAILKAFLSTRFSLGIGPASTTDELLYDLDAENVSPFISRQVGDLMNLCDGIKYAKASLGSLTTDDLFTRTRELILRKDWREYSRDEAYARKVSRVERGSRV